MIGREPIFAAALSLASLAAAACGGDGPAADTDTSEDRGGGPATAEGAESPTPGSEGEATSEMDEGVRGEAPAASGGLPSIVTLSPVDGSSGDEADAAREEGGIGAFVARPARGEEAVVDQFGLTFSPRVLVAAAGSPVRFTNSEGAITHNVHIRSIAGDSTVFNGDTGPSEGVDIELPGPGAYDVLCDMHPGMTGFIYVTDAPYAVAAETDGSFVLGPLEPGEYTARVWTAAEGLGPERTVTVREDPTVLDLTQPS